MSWFDRVIVGAIAPGLAVRRLRAKAALKVLAEYELSGPSRLRKVRTGKRSANVENERSVEAYRANARHLEQNHDIAKGALDILVANTVGSGIQPEPQVELVDGEPAEDLNRQLLEYWDDWIHTPEVTHQHDYYSLQRLLTRSWLRDGEVFGQKLIGTIAGLDHGTVVPMSLEGLEADFVPVGFSDEARGIVQGVELNTWGRPRAYHVYRRHPGERFQSADELKRVPADRVFHLKVATRLHQVRGMSVFASALARIDDLKEIDESERVAARVAAAMAAYIKKGTPDLYTPQPISSDGTRSLRQMEFVPGMIFDDLLPGEEIGTIAPNRPNNALIPFRDSQLRSAASGFGTSYSSLSKNYNGTYSAQRQEMVEQYVAYRILSSQLVYRLCQPVWDAFIMAAIASGLIRAGRDVNQATLYNAAHTLPPMPWIDPLKEAQANQIDEERGYKSRSRIIRERGMNPDQTNREIKRDQTEKERLGLKLGEASSGGQQPAIEPDPAEPAPQQ